MEWKIQNEGIKNSIIENHEKLTKFFDELKKDEQKELLTELELKILRRKVEEK